LKKWKRALFLIEVFAIISTCQFARAQIPENVRVSYSNILQLLGEKNYSEAVDSCKSLISRSPEFWEPYAKIVSAYDYDDKIEEAEKYFQNLKVLSPKNPNVFLGIALANKVKKDTIATKTNLLKAIGLGSPSPLVFMSLVETFRDLRQLDEGISYFQNMIKKDSSNRSYLGLGYMYYLGNNWHKAVKNLTHSIEMSPHLVRARLLKIAIKYLKSQNPRYLEIGRKKSFRGLELSRKLGDKDLMAHFYKLISEFYFALSDYPNGLSYADTAITIFNAIGNKTSEAQMKINLGELYIQLAENAKAFEYFKSALIICRESNDPILQEQTLI